jgi:hypothetical protein
MNYRIFMVKLFALKENISFDNQVRNIKNRLHVKFDKFSSKIIFNGIVIASISFTILEFQGEMRKLNMVRGFH